MTHTLCLPFIIPSNQLEDWLKCLHILSVRPIVYCLLTPLEGFIEQPLQCSCMVGLEGSKPKGY